MKNNNSLIIPKEVSLSGARNLVKSVSAFWEKTRMAFFFLFFLGLIALGMYIWQKSLFGFSWSEEKKLQYMDAESKGVSFDEKKFKSVIGNISERKAEADREYQPPKNIFESYK